MNTVSEALHIVLIEDDVEDIFVFRRLLHKMGGTFKLDVFNNGKQAKECLEQLAYDPQTSLPHMIMLDLNMPVMSGQDFLSWLRSVDMLAHLPVIVLTVSDDQETMTHARKLGANEALSKRFSYNQSAKLQQMIIDIWFYGEIFYAGDELGSHV